MDLSRIEAGRMDIDCEALDLVPLLEGACKTMGLMAQDKGGELSFRTDIESLVIDASETKCLEIINNLVSNAVRYTEQDFVQLSVVFRPDEELGAVAQIRVKDSGVGIPADQRHLFFQAFSQLGTESMCVGGNGLGLMLTARLVELHGGRIDVESEVGPEFIVAVPVSTPKSAAT
ncbi:MAG: signal transduction histidine kinase [Planctomycetota bacterium]|jgi:signal transduction histidine kinase